MILLVVVALFLVVDLVAWQWGVDSRDAEPDPEVWTIC